MEEELRRHEAAIKELDERVGQLAELVQALMQFGLRQTDMNDQILGLLRQATLVAEKDIAGLRKLQEQFVAMQEMFGKRLAQGAKRRP
jgi:hypothetical protein